MSLYCKKYGSVMSVESIKEHNCLSKFIYRGKRGICPNLLNGETKEPYWKEVYGKETQNNNGQETLSNGGQVVAPVSGITVSLEPLKETTQIKLDMFLVFEETVWEKQAKTIQRIRKAFYELSSKS